MDLAPRTALHAFRRNLKVRELYGMGVALYQRVSQVLPDGYALPPLHLALAPTMNCNLKCAFCNTRFGTPAPVDQVIDAVRALPTARIVSLTGGEPFCHPELLDILGRVARERFVMIETNGTLIPAETARTMAGLGPRHAGMNGLYFSSVSIHGPEEIHDRVTGLPGSYRRAKEAAAAIVASRNAAGRRFPRVMLKTTITRDLVGLLHHTHDLAAEVGADGVIYKIEDPAAFAVDAMELPRLKEATPVRYPAGVADDIMKELAEVFDRAGRDGVPPAMMNPASMPPGEVGRYYRGELDLREYACDSLWAWLMVFWQGGRLRFAMCNEYITGVAEGQTLGGAWNAPDLRRFRTDIVERGLRRGCMGCCFLSYRGRRAVRG